MASDFLLPWSPPNLLSLPHQQKKEIVNSRLLLEAAPYFEY